MICAWAAKSALIKEAFVIRNQFLSGSDANIEAMSGSLPAQRTGRGAKVRI